MNRTNYRDGKGYLPNKQFYEEVIQCQDNGEMSGKLGAMFCLLAKRFATKPQFNRYTQAYKEEMISHAEEACCKGFYKFDRTRTTNAFSYFTQCVQNAFRQVLNQEKNARNIRDALLVEQGLNPSFNYTDVQHTLSNNSQEKKPDLSSMKQTEQLSPLVTF